MADFDGFAHARLQQLIDLQGKSRGASTAARKLETLLAGRHGSKLRGRGMNFEEIRHYQQGDDIRSLDWKITRRTGKPHIRLFSEEKERPVTLVLDQRQNMFFGSQWKTKSVVAAELAAYCGWRTFEYKDALGAVIFNDRQITELRPRRNRPALIKVLENIAEANQALSAGQPMQADAEQFNEVLTRLLKICQHDHLIVLISDFHYADNRSQQLLRRLARTNNLICYWVADAMEQALPQDAQIVVTDGQSIAGLSGNRAICDSYADSYQQRWHYWHGFLDSIHCPLLPFDTGSDIQAQLASQRGGAL